MFDSWLRSFCRGKKGKNYNLSVFFGLWCGGSVGLYCSFLVVYGFFSHLASEISYTAKRQEKRDEWEEDTVYRSVFWFLVRRLSWAPPSPSSQFAVVLGSPTKKISYTAKGGGVEKKQEEKSHSPWVLGLRCGDTSCWFLLRPPFFFFSGKRVSARVRVLMWKKSLNTLSPRSGPSIWAYVEAPSAVRLRLLGKKIWIVWSKVCGLSDLAYSGSQSGHSCTQEWSRTVGWLGT